MGLHGLAKGLLSATFACPWAWSDDGVPYWPRLHIQLLRSYSPQRPGCQSSTRQVQSVPVVLRDFHHFALEHSPAVGFVKEGPCISPSIHVA